MAMSDFELHHHKYRENAHFRDYAKSTAKIDDPGSFSIVRIHLFILKEVECVFCGSPIGIASQKPIFLTHSLRCSRLTAKRVSVGL